MTSKARGLADLGNAYSDGALSNRNLIINGAMQVAQRGTTSTANGHQTVDRWRIDASGTDQLAFTQTQASDAPEGFAYSYKFTVTTPETSITDTEWVRAKYVMEGQDAQQLAFGTSSAKQTTLSFWVKSSVTGDYSVMFYLSDSLRNQTLTYTINSANTWEYKTIIFDGDTVSGINNDNLAGPDFYFSLSAGPDLKSSDATSWGSYVAARAAYGQTADVAGTSAATWQITGVQLEVGDTATPFEHRSYTQELAKCQRYFQKSAPQNDALKSTSGMYYFRDGTASTIQRYNPVRFVQTMRADPTVTIYDGNLTTGYLTQDTTNGRTAFTSSVGDQAMMVYGPSGLSHYSTRFGFYLDAEL